MTAVRSITFTLPAKLGLGVKVTAVENAVTGNLDFTLDVPGSAIHAADLRGLFFQLFDESDLAGLRIVNTDGFITGTQIKANKVIDLGNGNNLSGAASPFDVGIDFGTAGKSPNLITGPVHFTLDAKNPLTLDDIAHVLFGSRLNSVGDKLVFLAPAAPDAKDDTFGGAPNKIFEDGASGLDSPSTVPVAVTLAVLANDTDADGDALRITGFDDNPDHGTVTISADGKTALYTPNEDFSGTDSFVYIITDDHGGTDFATANVTVEAVADVPDLVYTKSAGATVNEIKITVTATETDADHSEFIDRMAIDLTSALPTGVKVTPESVNPIATDGTLTQTFVLTLPEDGNTSFDLKVNAWSKETSNADEQVGSVSIPIAYLHKSTTTPVEFTADNKSTWSTGDQFEFTDNRFLGLDTGNFGPVGFGPSADTLGFYGNVDGHFKLGFQSKLTFEGGEIDAKADYDITIEASYNKTTDQLQIDTGALLKLADFTTEGPEGSYLLDFIYDILLHAVAGNTVADDLDLGHIDLTIGPYSDSLNVINLNSDNLDGTYQFPGGDKLSAFSIKFAWPDITTDGTQSDSIVNSTGESKNFVTFNLDLDTLASLLVGLPPGVNLLDPPADSVLGIFDFDFDYLDVDVFAGLNFIQKFTMTLGDLTGILFFEDGTQSAQFNIGDGPPIINNASDIDLHGDHNGLVEFKLAAVPTATLHNDTDLGLNIGVGVDFFKGTIGAFKDVEFLPTIGPFDFGPLATFGDSTTAPIVGVFDGSFALAFGQEQVSGFIG